MNILVCDHYTPESLAHMAALGTVKKSASSVPNPTELAATDILMIRSRTAVTSRLLQQAPQLKAVITATSGFDHIDYQACANRNVAVIYTPGANCESAAEHTMALLLTLNGGVILADRAIRRHEWRDSVKRRSLLGQQQLGLVGFGRIGRRVAKFAHAFGMHIVAHDPYVNPEEMRHHGVEPLGLIELLISSDVISLHTPLTPETKSLINHQTLEHINPEAFLINTARGELIDEVELAVRMEKGLLRGAAFDVFEKEPLPQDSKLRSLKNVILTPHMGAYSEEAVHQASQAAVDELRLFMQGQITPQRLPLTEGWFDLWAQDQAKHQK